MDLPRIFPSPVAAEQPPADGAPGLVFADPWADQEIGRERRNSWMLSYIDILTLLLTLFVLLLVLQPKHDARSPQDLPQLARLAPLPPTLLQRQPLEHELASPSTALPSLIELIEQDLEQEITAETGAADISTLITTGGALELPDADLLLTEAFDPAMLASAPEPESAPLSLPVAKPAAADDAGPAPGAGQPANPASAAYASLLTDLNTRDLDSRLRISRIAEGVHLEVRDNILFAQGSDRLKAQGRHLLDRLAGVLSGHRGMISVEGHTDNRPISSRRFPSNWELSSGRATTVTRYLIGKGLDAARLRAVGYADTRPLESNDNTRGRARNRRVSLILELP